jgi:hypothetical protein
MGGPYCGTIEYAEMTAFTPSNVLSRVAPVILG